MTAPTPDTTSEISIFDVDFSSSYLNVLLQGNKWGGPLGSAATVYYSFPTSRNDAYWSQDFINGYGIFDPTTDGTPDYVSLTPLSSSQQNGITLALNAWASVANLNFIKVNETPSAVGDIRFGFTLDGAMSPDIYAYAYSVDQSLYEYSDLFPYTRGGDIWFNKNQPDQTGNNFSTGAMRYFVGLHEIGHALGLDHSFSEEEGDLGLPTDIEYVQYTVMSYSDLPGSNFDGFNEYYPTTPMLYDILAIQHLYGANNDYNAGNTVYEFSSSQRYYQTIWDAGGNDTIKYASSIGGIINLEAGSFSQLGKTFKVGANNATTQQDNIAIAFNVVIENAIGGSGNDKITGNSVSNILEGGAGNDTLDGSTGADSLIGGKGNDTYIVDNIGDVVTELANEGTDLVKTSVTYTLSAHVENLTLIGTFAIDGTGNDLNNTITGNDYDNTLYGNAGLDTLIGGAGNDTLDGGDGVDKLIGGNGDDTYIVDLLRTGTTAANYKVALQDTITETAVAGSGTDTVILRGDSINPTTFTTLTLDANIENLDASNTGSTKLNLTGNALANTLIGNTADNILDGGAGSDSLIGGMGNDTYLLDLKTTVLSGVSTLVFDDSITELDASNEGIDTVKLRGTATLTSDTSLILDNQWANIEILDASATGSTKLNLTGNDLGNTLIGNAAANILTGGTGNDTLNGGAGADTMIGGDGNDTYVVDHVGDSITELADNVSSQTYQTQYSSNNTGISADGRFVIFDSYSEFNFGNHVLAYDVFVKDMKTGVLIKANDYSEAFAHSISPDGKFVLYLSYTDNANHDRGLYLKNLETGENTLISTSSSGELGNSDAINDNARFSADGKFVSFSSYASNLSPDDTDHRSDIFVKNLITGTTTLVSTNSNGVKDNDGAVVSTISANGRYLTFHSTATNLSAADTNASIDVYWKDTLTNETKLVSSSASGTVGNNRSWYASISTDGNLVAFESSATNLLPTNDNAYVDIFLKNMTTGAIQRVSTSATGIEGNGNSENASISADGRYVLFESRASNLIANDTNGASDIFIKDLQTSAIQRVSTSSSNQQVSSESYNARFSANGKFVIFDSTSNNLVSGDNNPAVLDTFIKNLETGEVRLVSVQTQTTILNSGGTDLVNASISYTLSDHVENLTLTGTAAINGTGNDLNNVITGNAGNNILDGKGGTDTLIGGKGNDTYILNDENDENDEVVESLDEGIDLVKASVNYTLTNHVENLTLIGVDAINGTGNSINNTITGNDANNTLNGADGNDSLIGGAGEDVLDGGNGIDKLAGGIGNDTYVVDLVQTGNSAANFRVALQDTITEAATLGSSNDSVQLRGHYDHLNAATLTIGANLENLNASDTGTTKLNLTGNILANTLIGNDANNILDGGAGIDTLIGGLGDDTYVLDLKTTLVSGIFTAVFDDTITEFDGSDEGIDTVKLRGTASLNTAVNISLNQWTNIETLDASATGATKLTLKGNDEDNTLIGNNAANILEGGLGNDTLNGGAGADRMIGGKGWDTYYVDNIGDVIIEQVNTDTFLADEGVDTILSSISLSLANYANVEYLTLLGTAHLNATGNAGSNLLIGNSGNNILDGGGNRDDMQGGAGNDTYIVDDSNDQAIETLAGAAGGIDIVLSSVSFALNYNVENLTLTGTENIDGYGNELNNIIRGNAGNNRLSGGWDGSDTLIGGAGNDIYEVTYLFASAAKPVTQDTVIESLNAGIDRIILSAAGNNGLMNKYLMPLNVENLDANNTYGAFSHFIGNSSANYIIGNDYSHTFDGGAGVDTLVGGDLSDTYIVDLVANVNAGVTTAALQDSIIEDVSGTGSDTIQLRGNIALTTATTLTLNNSLTNIENLDASLTATSKLNLTGNDANNTLTGNAAANRLTGGLGNDILDGKAGADTLDGGDGDDTYFVDNMGDAIIELANQGEDTINTSISFDLSIKGEHVEQLNLLGTAAINATGNALDNLITGNSSANIINGNAGEDILIGGAGKDTLNGGADDDILIGGSGNDILTGGTGADTFTWNLADKGANKAPSIDKITDFNSTEDKLDLRDLLVGESSSNIQNYLDITTSTVAGVTNTEIRINNHGGFVNGNYAASAENQHITLAGVDLLDGTNEASLLNNLISQNKLMIDA
ncbi:matrixin family metalloprotease [Methylophilus sp.]|uniref:M10 family metallopeptidase C-terminal domain-containing protein n=1 Tax=Methylophilus sp. TaxID=29541 RepID=UPI0011D76483|nr:matrixin family metalloprotease [Methylophilus sp.]TXI44780.1 MAG: matrixin family metalloprotease [Methylophilus sp.]